MNDSYAALNFGKPLTEINRDDLIRFFATEREESDTMEFKSYYEKNQTNHNHKEAAVLKTICAFLNSSGGMLIWGAPAGHTPDGRQTKIFTGELSPVSRLIEKDTFISRTANAIFPLSNLVRMHRVEIDADAYAYIFDVEQSLHKPHQFDNRYWVRLDGQTGAAPHYLIDALFKQIRYPNLGGYIRFNSCRVASEGVVDLSLTIMVFNHSKNQNEYDMYFSITTSHGIFLKDTTEGVFDLDNHQYRRDEVIKILSYSHGPSQDITLRISHPYLPVNAGRRIEIMLAFGGRLSPMKRSEYELIFQRLSGLSRTRAEFIENMFSIDEQVNVVIGAVESSEEERVKSFLTYKPPFVDNPS